MKNIMKRGFTLIELLVVIAIIGILAGAVTISLSDSTDAAEDAKNKQVVANLRVDAELYAASDAAPDSGNTRYDGLCSVATSGLPGNRLYTEIGDEVKVAPKVFCKDSADGGVKNYLILFRLESNPTKWWCADGTNSPKERVIETITSGSVAAGKILFNADATARTILISGTLNVCEGI